MVIAEERKRSIEDNMLAQSGADGYHLHEQTAYYVPSVELTIEIKFGQCIFLGSAI